jgi:membrane protein
MNDRVRQDTGPASLGARGFGRVLMRTRKQAQRDHVQIVAAGVAFYAFLAVFPALAALVSVYGLVADPQNIQQQLDSLGAALPSGVREVLGMQMQRIAGASGGALGWGFALGLALALWSANKATRGLIEAINMMYDEEEKRGFFKLNALSLALTVGAIATAIIALFIVVAIPPLLGLVGLGGFAHVAVDVLRWPLLLAVLLVGLAIVYRLGPSREGPPWKWVTPGSLFATGTWLIVSIAFSIYVANFGSYDKTYGSLGAVAILLVWLYVGSLVILLGAELNAEAERVKRSTRAGSTRGGDAST